MILVSQVMKSLEDSIHKSNESPTACLRENGFFSIPFKRRKKWNREDEPKVGKAYNSIRTLWFTRIKGKILLFDRISLYALSFAVEYRYSKNFPYCWMQNVKICFPYSNGEFINKWKLFKWWYSFRLVQTTFFLFSRYSCKHFEGPRIIFIVKWRPNTVHDHEGTQKQSNTIFLNKYY